MPTTTRSSIPEHVAIIMDGNGRWAKQRGLPRVMGHRRGVEAVRETVRAAGDCGIRYLTLFAFSSENWRRPESEVSDLMGLLKAFIRRDLAELHRENVRVRIIGDRQGLKHDIRSLLEEAEQMTADNTKLTLVIAFNYGSRDEIARATAAIARDVADGKLNAESITPEMISARLDTSGMPDPDLIIRTSGEERLSNFLLWQAAYSEFLFVPEYWPDFDRQRFFSAIEQYATRDRRFGALTEQVAVAGA
ncbi:Undecaprenyl pyrophosphate synthetase 2 (UPP synthetase 2) (Di-trans,poly-cis-decaprenylcistransferase 2) (Undecaprenyl diphosphate synthase 2) (UDS 2) [Agrobacterium deltaense Zutra 3/1]|uniref:Isoprenyl transferase n=1 Tax=Agrobacterium deltaense Zutra 3/1 TaxID=1183427 RepID=A0A1S7PIE8_9HYPH|nr:MULTISPECIES: isoprenyl transferase [Rhizobium/Agrobacterium group]TKV74546.1 isoprenyl transferase [Rhizobium sp. AU243]CUX21942.1 Undecaprenyl pyrophosphate synthetase 2 (UPP synthetase 2) (Di-trans,poly-cis-decaprenylcistransferase 2) (Undecaprenyl diphosphate synthase 2) (UDS 2) [Agrobacterium deltaense Zutra 3/1]